MLIKLRRNLFNNEKVEDAISGGYPETDPYKANQAVVFLSLFVS